MTTTLWIFPSAFYTGRAVDLQPFRFQLPFSAFFPMVSFSISYDRVLKPDRWHFFKRSFFSKVTLAKIAGDDLDEKRFWRKKEGAEFTSRSLKLNCDFVTVESHCTAESLLSPKRVRG